MFVLKLLLKTTEYDEDVLNKRFNLMNKCHNVLVKHSTKQLNLLRRNKKYIRLIKSYKKAKDAKDSNLIKTISAELNSLIDDFDLSKNKLEKYISVWQKRNAKNLSSLQCQKEAERVFNGICKVLYSSGKKLNYHKYGSQHTICGKNTTNGIKFDLTELEVKYLGLEIKLRKLNEYQKYVLSTIKQDLSNVSYFEISREIFNNGYHYYLDIYIKEKPVFKHAYGSEVSGIDPGVSTVAFVSENSVKLAELASECKKYNDKIKEILKKMDRSRRSTNPENYNPDGTVKPNCKKFYKSKNYLKLLYKLKTLYRKKSAYIKQSHEILANQLIENSIYIYIEKMSYKGLAKKSEKTEKQNKISKVKGKEIHKFKKKKRFGSSMNNRSPSSFIEILKRKVNNLNGFVMEINTKKYKASQYNHITNKCDKMKLSDRFKLIGNYLVQRDLYSAFLIFCTANTLDHPDRNKCFKYFEDFVKLQNKCIEQTTKK